jgi:protein TonB
VDSKPPRIFDAAAIQAILKWKFKPRVEGGVPIPQAGITTIEFNI